MAAFPAITPSTRRYGFGMFPVTAVAGFGGGAVRFLHGITRSGINLELGFESLSETEAQQLRDHYRGQDGGYSEFTLPNAIWAGHSSPNNIPPSGAAWIYAEQPSETHRVGLLFDVRVRLLQVI
jgi:hypothetical protein